MNKNDFTHYGWFCGLAPVYVSPYEPECPMMARHWSLEPLFDVVEFLFGVYCLLVSIADPDFEPYFPIQLTGEIRG